MSSWKYRRGCNKRGFDSQGAAMRSNRSNSHALRLYRCPRCQLWHVAKADYR